MNKEQKIVVTDDLVKLALGKFHTQIPLYIPEMQSTRLAMKAALEAVFDSEIPNNPVEEKPECKERQHFEGWVDE